MSELFRNGYWFFFSRWFTYQQNKKVRRSHPFFARYLKAFQSSYRHLDPFALCRESIALGPDQAVYGETPFSAFEAIAKRCYLTQEDHFVDLGCGRGLGLFFLSELTGCSGLGVDCVPLFIEKAQAIHSQLSLTSELCFECRDLLQADLSLATCIYLYGTCLSDKMVYQLIERFLTLSSAMQIVTVSYPLSDYSSEFVVVDRWEERFVWGKTDLYLNIRVGFSSQLEAKQRLR